MTGLTTLVELLRHRARTTPDAIAYIFLRDGEDEEERLTYAELDQGARRIAGHLIGHGIADGRALLLFPPGPAYVRAFFGCLYARVVAVPAYPPLEARGMHRLTAIAADARAGAALTEESLFDTVRAALGETPVRLIADGGEGPETEEPVDADDLAFLQYTSGSTRDPRGVMLTHANLMHNLGLMHHWFQDAGRNVAVSWLPPYHDMGLIGAILEPLYAGFPAVLMSPLHFLERPRRWLEAISRYRATVSPAPNFAYDLCVRKAAPEGLDLSSWRLAINGAEPVRPETLDRFCEVFGPVGFRRKALRPSYGLAEATLLVTSDGAGEPPRIVEVDGVARVACGRVIGDQSLKIVDTVAPAPVPPGTVGEIWLSGPSVARGYWGHPAETHTLFGARLPGDDRPYLRTGDLGRLTPDGRLVVTGRIKDVIVLRGRNVYPQDVELAVERSHPAVRPGCGAAFPVPVDGEERLVVVQEVTEGADQDRVATACRRAVREDCDADVHEVVLIAPRTIPKTSSGKIQRRATREAYLSGALAAIGGWRASADDPADFVAPRTPVEELIARLWADLLGVDRVGVHDNFFTSGGESILASRLAARIQEELPVRLGPGDVFEAPTVARLATLVDRRPLSVGADELHTFLTDLETDGRGKA